MPVVAFPLTVPAKMLRLGLSLLGRVERSAAGEELPLQAAALPWRRGAKGDIEILLVTSRSSGKWIPPKGWPMRGKSLAEAAQIEAYEEAGVRGRVSDVPCGAFQRPKTHRALGPITFLIKLYPLEVTEELKTWPEQAQRKRRWFAPEAAADAVQPAELAALLQGFRVPRR